MARTRHILAALLLAGISLAGCATFPGTARPADLAELRREEGWLLLESVPFVAQVTDTGCGAACLAMVLGHWGSDAPVDALERECGVTEGVGIRAASLRDAARRRGLAAFLFEGSVADLEHELARGRPVVVGIVKPYRDEFTSHFAVVVGLHRERGRIAMLDPAAGLLCDSIAGFEDEWRPTRGVTLVVFLQVVALDVTRVEAPQGGGGS
jgi:ABC-type bacteriocin/lantibiotic exporter with double-glycine peptidase domain